MKESVGDGDDANLAALHVKNLRTGVARGRSLLRADGEGEQDDRHGLPHASREVFVHSASIQMSPARIVALRSRRGSQITAPQSLVFVAKIIIVYRSYI